MKYRLPYQANKGNASTTFMQTAARKLEAGTLPHLHCRRPRPIRARHGPEPQRATRSLYKAERGIEFVRVALTMAQIKKFDLPPDYTKPSDSKGKALQEGVRRQVLGGREALPVPVLLALVEKAITAEIDQAEWDAVAAEERERRDEALAKLGKAKWLD